MKKMLALLVGCFYLFRMHGVSSDDTDKVSVLEGDSVILHTDVDRKQEDRITWYFNNIRIAQINGDQSKICTDVQCPQRFRDKLNLTDRSLMIININTSDAGVYKLQIASRNIEKTFSITVRDVSAAERDQMNRKSVKEGESVTLNPGVIKTNDLITWYFNDTRIAEIKAVNTSTNVHSVADETFRDGLKLNHQTGSLIITNTRTTDSGLYKLQISSSRFSIIRSINVTVTELAREHFCALVLVLLLFAVAAAAITKCQKGK
ncbi:uncharacterized protein LOC127160423 isoform X2 [Labeo rohita]|uniref:uncharacterized protein LOC127160423 isoform X2 n=1 Tax=Labeo rohita TaxID=84645 RepID=UPI0021E1E8AB|nr:uncharacterized protein LOC127160423 isoform X2 [Labeo rohita]